MTCLKQVRGAGNTARFSLRACTRSASQIYTPSRSVIQSTLREGRLQKTARVEEEGEEEEEEEEEEDEEDEEEEEDEGEEEEEDEGEEEEMWERDDESGYEQDGDGSGCSN